MEPIMTGKEIEIAIVKYMEHIGKKRKIHPEELCIQLSYNHLSKKPFLTICQVSESGYDSLYIDELEIVNPNDLLNN